MRTIVGPVESRYRTVATVALVFGLASRRYSSNVHPVQPSATYQSVEADATPAEPVPIRQNLPGLDMYIARSAVIGALDSTSVEKE